MSKLATFGIGTHDGADNATLDAWENRLTGILLKAFGGATIVRGIGPWQGETKVYIEPCFSAVVATDATETELIAVAAELAQVFEQEAVFLAWHETTVHFVGPVAVAAETLA